MTYESELIGNPEFVAHSGPQEFNVQYLGRQYVCVTLFTLDTEVAYRYLRDPNTYPWVLERKMWQVVGIHHPGIVKDSPTGTYEHPQMKIIRGRDSYIGSSSNKIIA